MKQFQGRSAVLATMHGKERVIAPLLEHALGIHVILPPEFDTDVFGTFTREKARMGNQRDAARAKARAAMLRTNTDIGIASEGSFGPDPSIPFTSTNIELILFIDDNHGIEAVGQHQTYATNMASTWVQSAEEATAWARQIGFPEHGIIVRTKENGGRIIKDIQTLSHLEEVVRSLIRFPWRRYVFLETDMRAHRNPTRMQAIHAATNDLLTILKRTCPLCGTPGFSRSHQKRGAPCSLCLMPTDQVFEQWYVCRLCEHTSFETIVETVNPRYCSRCNP
ncbi:hypothetical protein EBR66_02325 [bacterium]|nr:hypothetical protein [bacterium]